MPTDSTLHFVSSYRNGSASRPECKASPLLGVLFGIVYRHMGRPGTFVVSLDFELFWGMHDVVSREEYGPRILGVREAIPKILELFEKYDIHATWAVVGMVACKDVEHLQLSLPDTEPEYENKQYSTYEHIRTGAVTGESARYYFAPELVEQVRRTKGQEVGCHTFSHYFCNEAGATPEAFRADIKTWNTVVNAGESAHSIVFPRNQVDSKHLAVCRELGIQTYRGNQQHALYDTHDTNKQYKPQYRLLRLIDSYVNISGHHTYPVPQKGTDIANVPASRFWRPYSRTLSALEPLKQRRVMSGMTHAAQHGEVFHLWWHPHNFGFDTQKNLDSLEIVLKHFATLREQRTMESKSMGELVS